MSDRVSMRQCGLVFAQLALLRRDAALERGARQLGEIGPRHLRLEQCESLLVVPALAALLAQQQVQQRLEGMRDEHAALTQQIADLQRRQRALEARILTEQQRLLGEDGESEAGGEVQEEDDEEPEMLH